HAEARRPPELEIKIIQLKRGKATNMKHQCNHSWKLSVARLMAGLLCWSLTAIVVQADNIKPPSNLIATAISASQINLQWVDNSSNETGTKIERAPNSAGPWNQIATVGPNVTSFSDIGLSSGTT